MTLKPTEVAMYLLSYVKAAYANTL